MKRLFSIFLFLAAAITVAATLYIYNSAARASDDAVSSAIDMERMERADSVICRAIAHREFPGAVLCVVKRAADARSRGDVLYLKAYGDMQLYSSRDTLSGEYCSEPISMREDAIFDLASLTKSVGTTLAFMHAMEEGYVTLNGKVKEYIPDFKAWDSIAPADEGKSRRKSEQPKVVERRDITIMQLLTHTSGMPAGVYVPRFMERFEGKQLSREALVDSLENYLACEERRLFRPGSDMLYSCQNFILLQRIIERATGESIDSYTTRHIFAPLGLKDTRWNPVGEQWQAQQRERVVPTEILADGTLLRGDVHDPLARIIMGGVSGNAGLFSTAQDLATIVSMIMNGGEIGDVRVLSEASIATMMRIPECYAAYGRALGWDGKSEVGGSVGDLMTPHNVIYHTGYTGTSLAIDMERGIAIILLTNRVHPDDGGSVGRTRNVVANIIMSAIN
ncbi:MAG: serine hydrolase [Alistipes sp.]|nr:serine hydrolase [Alistipes sp.]